MSIPFALAWNSHVGAEHPRQSASTSTIHSVNQSLRRRRVRDPVISAFVTFLHCTTRALRANTMQRIFSVCLCTLALFLLGHAHTIEYPTFVSVPGGTFFMGQSTTPLPPSLGKAAIAFPLGDFDERPYHNVTVSSFWMSATEVTNVQFDLFAPDHAQYRGRYNFSAADDDAVLFVGHEDATSYCAWLTATLSDGRTYRLPTEAEWEWAARGSDSSTRYSYFWTGDTVPDSMQNDNTANAGMPKPGVGRPTRVQRFAANGYGLYDTIGNVEEWVSDWYGPYPESDQVDPRGPGLGAMRVTRGGMYAVCMDGNRSAVIHPFNPMC
jgi:sulfatase modifying factor 1